jgi:hypothetical protein
MKFTTKQGIGETRGEHVAALKCHMAFLKGHESKETLTMEGIEERDKIAL